MKKLALLQVAVLIQNPIHLQMENVINKEWVLADLNFYRLFRR